MHYFGMSIISLDFMSNSISVLWWQKYQAYDPLSYDSEGDKAYAFQSCDGQRDHAYASLHCDGNTYHIYMSMSCGYTNDFTYGSLPCDSKNDQTFVSLLGDGKMTMHMPLRPVIESDIIYGHLPRANKTDYHLWWKKQFHTSLPSGDKKYAHAYDSLSSDGTSIVPISICLMKW